MSKEDKYLIDVGIILRGEKLQPEHVSELLRLKPSRSQNKGGLRHGSKSVIAKTGVWTLMAESNSKHILDRIDELLEMLSEIQIPLDKIDGVTEAFLDIFITSTEDNNESRAVELNLGKMHMQILCLLGLGLKVTYA